MAFCLDISRTVSRLGPGGASGVDRVERAYIDALRATGEPVLYLARVAGGAAILDDAGLEAMHAAPLSAPDPIGRLSLRQSPDRRRADTAVRRHCLGWARARGIAALVRAHLPRGFVYINVGHLNLGDAVLDGLRAGGARRIAVMIHDVIPLDFPEIARPETPGRFRAMLAAIARHADLVIFNSADTARRAGPRLAEAGRSPPSVTAPLGTDRPPGRPAPATGRDFVALGTIEPRKNHLLLLQIWRQFYDEMPAQERPQLHIVGRRGWENGNVFATLDRAPMMGVCVFEHGHLPDDALAARLAGARALLFPSFAEGFGLPLAEALALGRAVVCSDLPVFREIATQGVTFLDPTDGPGWKNAVLEHHRIAQDAARPAPVLPDWRDHFSIVLNSLRD